jgi:hypothetical protein
VTPAKDPSRHPWRLLFLCLLFGAALSLAFRSDANWDLQNYHLYAPFAVWNGRIGLDYFAAGFQGYLNPLADLPYFIAKMILFPNHPALVAALVGLPFGAMVFLVVGIADGLLPEDSGSPAPRLRWLGQRWSVLLVAAIGLTGATILSEVGTTYGDIVSADAILLGVFAALKLWPGSWRTGGAMGLCLGAAAGLKLTALIFLPGMAIFVLLGAADRRSTILGLLALGAGAIAGFLVVWGWWGLTLWRHFHNPFFPMFGRLFPSPWSIDMDPRDGRFFPRSMLQWIAYPFFWLEGRSFVVTETHLRDPRFALAYIALLAAGLRAILPGRPPIDRRVLGLWLFFAVSYTCWLIGFSILRYALPLEALSGIVMATSLRYVAALRLSPRVLALALALVACVVATRPMGWGRIGYGRDLVETPIPKLPGNAVVFIVGAPLGFVIPYVASPGDRFLRPDFLTATSPESAIIRNVVSGGESISVFLLTNFPADEAGRAGIAAGLAPFGLSASETDCRPIHSPVQRDIRLCGVTSLR